MFVYFSASALRHEARQARGADARNFCDSTVRRRLNRVGLRSRVAANKPHLILQHTLTRLAWARAHRHWNQND